MQYQLVKDPEVEGKPSNKIKRMVERHERVNVGKLRNEMRRLLRWADEHDEKWSDARKKNVAQQLLDLERKIIDAHELALEIAEESEHYLVDYGNGRAVPALLKLPAWVSLLDDDNEDASSEEE